MATTAIDIKKMSKTEVFHPQGHSIIPRKGIFPFSNKIPRNWQGEKFTTRFMDSIQLAFPDGERMFINSVRNYKDAISDPGLQQRVRDFNYQEGQHGNAHTEYTELLNEQGIKADLMVGVIQKAIHLFERWAPHKFQLATTVAAEHLTATLAEDILNNDFDMFDEADPIMSAFYAWHAIEEVEHKSVAWEVYEQAANGGYLTRLAALGFMVPVGAVLLAATVPTMLYADNALTDRKELAKGYNRLLGKNGIGKRMLPALMEYFKPNFHPWDSGYPKHFKEWKKSYEGSSDPVQAYQHIRKQIDD